MLQLLPNNNCMNSKGRVSTLLLNTIYVQPISQHQRLGLFFIMLDHLNIHTSILNSPTSVGHIYFLEPMLILI